MRPLPVSSRSVRFLVFAVLAAALLAFAPANARAQAGFYAVGDLAGGSFHSEIRDATKVGGTILAVGSSNGQSPGCADPCPTTDTAILWKWDGVSATLTPLPNLVVNTTAQTPIIASAITPDGAYIASRARSNAFNGQRQAVRVQTSLLPSSTANLNLALLPPGLSPNTYASSISNDGSVLYGFATALTSAVRFDVANGSSMAVPRLAGAIDSTPAGRGTSADGSVLVGWSGTLRDNSRAFRYVHGSGVSEIPKLPGGTWNAAEAVSSDGNLVLVAGNSSAYPNGEVYLYDASTSTSTPFGSPNSAWSPNNFSGMTADGSVVAISFGGPSRGFAYFHNSRGWFHLVSALGAGGIDLKAQGWTELAVLGISADGTLVFGQGVHNDKVEGYVAEFPAGYLAAFDAPAVALSNTSIVGAWHVSDTESGSPVVVVFLADGTYYMIQPTVLPEEINAAPGLERGVYSWNAATGAFTVTTLNDTNGDAGLSDNNGMLNATLFVAGDTLSLTDGGPVLGTRIAAPANTPLQNTLVGGWVIGNPAAADASAVVVFDGDGTYYYAQDGPNDEGGGRDGIEKGSYTWDPSVRILAAASIAVDTNGDWGLSNPFGPISMQPISDGLVATADDGSGPLTAHRIIDPGTVVPAITSPLSAVGTLGVPFSYTVSASQGAFQFGASGLPAGLSIDGSTGVISGAPTAFGSFAVTISASNTLRTGTATLDLVIVTTVTTSAGTDVTVQPEVPSGTAPVAITFGNVTQSGTTTLTVIDPATAPEAQAPPAGFALGDPPVYYEISTTAVFSGPVTLCFNYAGVNFGGDNTPRLFHFENGAWTDVTTSVDSVNTMICGVATSFSPFAIFASPAPFVTRTGFYSPVSMVNGFVNAVKGGSTVPLKFNVYVNGVEKKDTAGLEFSVSRVNCTTAAEEPVGREGAGGTALRYDKKSRQFVQNWQTPKGRGCYVARMTTTADGQSISALFKTK